MGNRNGGRTSSGYLRVKIMAAGLALGVGLGVMAFGVQYAGAAPPLANVSGMILNQGADSTQMNLTWYADSADVGVPAATILGGATFTGSQGAATSGQNWNKVTLTGLAPGTTYQFQVSNTGTDLSQTFEFTTVGAGGFRFAAVGDPQIGTSAPIDSDPSIAADAASWAATVVEILNRGAEFIVGTGDQIENANQDAAAVIIKEKEYAGFIDGLNRVNTLTAFSPAMGNHEADGSLPSGVGRELFDYHYTAPNQMGATVSGFKLMNYYYLVNNVLYVVLDTAPYPGDPTAAAPFVAAYDATLTAATTTYSGQYDWLIVQTHKSQMTTASHWDDADIRAYSLAGFEDVMTKHGVDLVLTGHDHSYNRTYPLKSVYSAIGTGGPLVANGMTIDQDNTGDTLVYPDGTVYVALNSSSGSKYYAIQGADKFTTAVQGQNDTPEYTIIDLTATKLAVKTYEVGTGHVVDAFTIEKPVATVTFDLNTGTSPGVTPITVKPGSVVALPNDPVKAADNANTYTFAGWFTAASGGQPFTASTVVTADLTVYAQWIATPRSLTGDDPGTSQPRQGDGPIVETGGSVVRDTPIFLMPFLILGAVIVGTHR